MHWCSIEAAQGGIAVVAVDAGAADAATLRAGRGIAPAHRNAGIHPSRHPAVLAIGAMDRAAAVGAVGIARIAATVVLATELADARSDAAPARSPGADERSYARVARAALTVHASAFRMRETVTRRTAGGACDARGTANASIARRNAHAAVAAPAALGRIARADATVDAALPLGTDVVCSLADPTASIRITAFRVGAVGDADARSDAPIPSTAARERTLARRVSGAARLAVPSAEPRVALERCRRGARNATGPAASRPADARIAHPIAATPRAAVGTARADAGGARKPRPGVVARAVGANVVAPVALAASFDQRGAHAAQRSARRPAPADVRRATVRHAGPATACLPAGTTPARDDDAALVLANAAVSGAGRVVDAGVAAPAPIRTVRGRIRGGRAVGAGIHGPAVDCVRRPVPEPRDQRAPDRGAEHPKRGHCEGEAEPLHPRPRQRSKTLWRRPLLCPPRPAPCERRRGSFRTSAARRRRLRLARPPARTPWVEDRLLSGA